MDVPLYAIALAVFAVLYLVMGVFLAFTLIIAFIILFLYLAIRYGNVPQNYPHTLGDVLITVIFTGVTWGIFVYLGPKNPVPFIGSGRTFNATAVVPIASIVEVSLALVIVFLIIGAFVVPRLTGSVSGGGATMGDNKPKQGVGAG